MDYSKLLDQVENLSDLLEEPLDLEATLETALTYILQAINRTSGIVYVSIPDQQNPQFLISQNSSQHWTALIRDENSKLIQLAYQVTETGTTILSKKSLDVAAAVPIKVKSECYGAILIGGSSCSPEEVEALEYFARPVARMIDTELFKRKATLRSQELSAIQLISTLSRAELSPDEMQARIVRSLCRILSVERCSLVLLDDVDNNIAFKKIFKGNSGWLHQTFQPLRQGIISDCINTRQPTKSNDVRTDDRYHKESDDIPEVITESMLCAPILNNDKIQGAVVTYNKHNGQFDSYDQKVILATANLLAYAMKDINLVQKLRVTSAELEVNRWQLLNSRNTLRALFDSIPLSFYIVDQKYELVAINLSRSKRLGIHPSEIVGKLCYNALYGRDEPCPGCQVSKTLFGGLTTHRIKRNFLNDGNVIEWEINTFPIKDDKGQVVQAIHFEQDMTEKRRLENQVIQSEKLAVVGQLAAGVAHEINNPLSAIIANAQLLKNELNGSDEDTVEALELIELASNKAAQVVKNLLNLARRDQYDFEQSDVNESIGKAISLVQHELNSHGVSLTTNLQQELPYIKLSQEHIQGVWTNLILNGIDAQKERGNGEIIVESSQSNSDILVTITDKGTGIEPENLTKIFEPFFTTKDSASGTGLGLAICQKVVKHHGGKIEVQSTLGEGTIFSVSLPV